MSPSLVLAALLGTADVAHAAETWEVTGVWPTDVLYVRASPDSAAAIVGALPADAVGIRVVTPDASGWTRIESGTIKGYVGSRFLARSTPTTTPTKLRCRGTEPFWSLSLDGARATLETPDDPTVTVELKEPLHPGLAPQPWLFEPKRAGGVSFLLVSETRRCTEGLVGEETSPLRYEVTLRTGSRLLSGCCSVP